MIIDYDGYLDGDEWPSESGRPMMDSGGSYQPEMKPVYDMPPQYASAALHKLVRWARDGAMNAEQEDSEERRVRNSTLGRLLARKALGIEDFELYSEHGIDREPLGNMQAAKVICTELFEIKDVDLDPVTAAQVSMHLAVALNNDGFLIYKDGEQ